MSVWKRLSNVAWGTTRVWGRRSPPGAEAALDQELAESPPAPATSPGTSTARRGPPSGAASSSVRSVPDEPVPRTDLFGDRRPASATTASAVDDPTAWLLAYLARHGGVAGTVHHLPPGGGHLSLVAHHRIPPPVLEVTRSIPHGKGMAGLAWARGAPVQTCDLQSDTTGDVRPGARAVDAGAAVAIPVFRGDRLVAVVGIAFATPGDLAPDRLAALSADAADAPVAG